MASSTITKSLYALRVDPGSIQVDGKLDEAAWREAPVGSSFVERIPTPGAVPPVRTEVRVLVDRSTLYVAVTSILLDGETPRALELQRDSFGLFSDDAISLKIDVRHDTRTTVGFATNPAGTQLDYVAIENGSGFRREVDAIWNVATTVQSDRWIAEFELPAVALGLPRANMEARIVGLNVTRDHNARLATYDWSPIPPEFGPTSALFYGDLLGLEELGGGRRLSLLPYGLGAYESSSEARFRARAGGDIRLQLADDVWAELTVLTDFAQVDLDDPVVNLDRFPLFFPERRPFFLSGIEFFEFGASGEAQVFFSRRIGLDEQGMPISLLGGAKSYGTAGELRFGALGAFTEDSGETPAQGFGVLRLRQNFGENGHLGLIGTLRNNVKQFSSGEPDANPQVSIGVDGAIRGFSRRLEANGFVALSAAPYPGPGDEDTPEGFASQATLQWRGYHLQPLVSLLVVSPSFDPAVGFVRRPGQITPRVFLPWVTRTTAGGLQQIIVEVDGSVVRGYEEDRVLTQSASLEVDVLLRSNFGFNAFIQAKEDLVQEPQEIVGFTVEPDRYRGYVFFFGIRSPSGRNPSGELSFTHDTSFFGGEVDTFSGSIEARWGPHFLLSGSGELSLFQVPDTDGRTTLTANARGTWAFDTRTQLDLIGQTNTFAERAILLARLRWRYLPGSDLFAVYREDLDWTDRALRAERSLTLKIGYRYDALL